MATKPSAKHSKTRSKSSREKVQIYRERMRAAGMRLIQMWVPDTRTAAFAKEARQQSILANRSRFAAEDQAWADAISPGMPD
jgi:hypothetical protein